MRAARIMSFWRATLAGFAGIGSMSCSRDSGPRSCSDNTECLSFQACEAAQCSCDPRKCRGTCFEDICIRSECSMGSNRCGTPGFDLCEPGADECYPSNGRCTAALDCPIFDARHVPVCGADGFCHVAAPESDAPLMSEVAGLVVQSPAQGQRFESADTLAFRWTPQPGPVIAVVSSTRPASVHDLSAPLWAAFLPPGRSEVRWAQGGTPDGSRWAPPAAELPSGTLFFVATAYDGTIVSAISSAIAFRVNDSWPHIGADCVGDRLDGSECATPNEPLVCYQTRCERPCLSNADCRGIADERCGRPIPGQGRYCGIETDTASVTPP
jgi:hypothetical protein